MQTTFMEETENPDIATCPTCGTLIDVAEMEPYAKIHCSSCGTWLRVRQQFANYEITGVLGEGGQGLVYQAVDNKLKRNVAIKLMKREYSADPIFVKRFESEARVTASLNHPNIVKVFSFGEDRGLLYLAMEMVDSGSLDALMAQITKVPEERVLEVGIQIANGLQAGLEKGLIHRDIKPGNILFADEHTAKIVDFGLAVLVEKQSEEEGDVWATPYYVSPEKLDGKPEDFRSDMYSLAATLFHAIAGRPPFIAETSSIEDLKRIKSKPVHLQSYARQASDATAYVIDKALAVRPEDRWASYAEFIENLEYARNETGKKGPKVRRPRPVATALPGKSGGWKLIAILLAVVAFGAYILRTPGLWKKKTPVAAKPSQRILPALTAEEANALYEVAREKLIAGDFRASAVTFRELYADGLLPEPRHSWSAVHEGLCELFDGHPVPARNAFRSMSQKLTPNAIGMDTRLEVFLRRISTTASGDDPAPPEAGAKFDNASYEAIGLLILGLKNWETGAFGSGVALLRDFREAAPAGKDAWVGDYRPLVGRYLDDYAAYQAAEDDIRQYEKDPARAEAMLARLETVKAKIKTSGLTAKLDGVVREFKPKITEALAAERAKMALKMAEAKAAEERMLTAAKYKVKKLCESYQFSDALRAISAVELKADELLKDSAVVKRRVEWLVQFKDQLVKDLAFGYNGPLQRKNGQSLPGGVIRATDTLLKIRVGAGSAEVDWAELSPQSVLAMARAFIRAGIDPNAAADRKWRAGVFAIFAALYADSELLMGEAASVKEEYRINKALFFGSGDDTPAPAPRRDPDLPPAPKPRAEVNQVKDPVNPFR